MKPAPKVLKAIIAFALVTRAFSAEEDESDRLETANIVLGEIMSAPDEEIPHDLLGRAHCIVIIPGARRAGLVVGASYGEGVASCRDNGGNWTAPSIVTMESGSVGVQFGAGETDLVMMVLNDSGKDRLLNGGVTVGGEAVAMAGKVGRHASAETGASLDAEIVSYSKSRGAFAGANLKTLALRPLNKANQDLYGKPVDHREILEGKVTPPKVAAVLLKNLAKFSSSKEESGQHHQ